MRNATVSSLIYECLFGIYRIMEEERKDIILLPDEAGTLHQTFDPTFMSKWEWSTSLLENAGTIRKLKIPHSDNPVFEIARKSGGPYIYPSMTLDECHVADFSAFESFDNYCHAMFVLFMFGYPDFYEGKIDLNAFSPRFLEDVARKDDLFLFTFHGRLVVDADRFDEKVMGHWDEMPDRRFRRNGE